MSGIVNFPLFVAAVALLNATPGPDTAYIVGRSVAQGRRAGLLSALGISAGCCVHSLACAFGLTALLAASAAAFTVIKVAGAIYLIYLGARMLLNRERGQVSLGGGDRLDPDDGAGEPAVQSNHAVSASAALPAVNRPLRRLFMQGFWTNVLNPKVVLFFVSFFPQFVKVGAAHQALDFLLLGAVFVLMSTVWNSGVALLASSVTRKMSGVPAARRWLDRLVGCAFIGLGVRLATLRR